MDPSGITPLTALVIVIVLASFGWYKKPRNLLSKVFTASFILIAYCLLTEFVYRHTTDQETAFLWVKANSCWPLVLATFMHFVLIYTGYSKLLKHKLTYVLLYLPAVMIFLTELSTDLITTGLIMTDWSWMPIYSDNITSDLVALWVMAIALLSVFLCWRFYLRATEPAIRLQAGVVAAGISFAMIAGWIITEVLFPWLGINFPGQGMPALVIGGILIVYSMWKQGFMYLTPEIASEEILETMSELMLLVNYEGTIIRINKAVSRTLGYKEDELIGQDANIILPEEIKAKSMIENAQYTDKPITEISTISDTFLKTTTDKSVPVSLSMSIIYGEDNSVAGLLCIARDITERKQGEEKLRKSEEQYRLISENLEKEMKKREEFNRTLVHELKTPLTPIIAASEILLGEIQDENIRRLVSSISRSAYTMSNRIDTLLDLARGEMGTLELEMMK